MRLWSVDFVVLKGYESLEAAIEDIRKYVFYYNNIRPHSYHRGLPPNFVKKPVDHC